MTVNELKEQFIDAVKSKWGEFQESSLYIQVKEKYDDLSPGLQKVVIVSIFAIIAVFLILPPTSWIESSSSYIENFENKKTLIRNLLQLKRDIGQAPQVPNGIPSSALKSQVDTAIRTLGLTADQIKGVEEVSIANDGTSHLIPSSVTQAGVQLTVWKINLTQFLDLSYRIQRLSPSTKLLSIDMKANSEDVHYYDVIFQLISFSVPQAEIDEGAPDK